MSWIVSSTNFICWSPNPQMLGSDFIWGNRITEDIIRTGVGRVGPQPNMISVLIKRMPCEEINKHAHTRAHTHTHSTPCEYKGRIQSDASTSQHTTRSQRRGPEQILPLPSEGTNPAHSLTSGFWSPELGGNTFLLYKSLRLWHRQCQPYKTI